MTPLVPDPEKVPGAPGSLTLAGAEKPKRVTTSEMLRALMGRWESAQHERAGVEITRNAQGKVQCKVSVHDPDPEVALARARELYDALDLIYPYEMVERPKATEKG